MKKIIVRILLAVGIIIAVFLIAALFIDKEYAAEREIVINKPEQEVFDYIKHVRNQVNYSAWVLADPAIKNSYRGTDATTGFIYAWESEKMGKGEQEIKGIAEGERLDLELRFIEPFEGLGHAYITTKEVSSGQTKVTWGMKGECKYPMNFMNLFMDKMLGSNLESSLQALKGILEKK